LAKIDLQDFVKYGKLFEVYKNLLSEDRQNTMSLYFDYNMTLAEIAKEKGVSRQAVLDTIEKSCQRLEEYENALHHMEMVVFLEQYKQKAPKDVAEKVEEILRKI